MGGPSGLQNVLRPGSREFVVVLNVVLALLFFVMFTVIYTELEDSLHVFVLLFLVVGLAISINWFILQVKSLPPVPVANRNKQQPLDSTAARDKTD